MGHSGVQGKPDLASTLTQAIRSSAREEMRMLSCDDYLPC